MIHDVNGLWYNALRVAIVHVIVDMAKLMVEQAFVLLLEHWQIQLPRPALRRILRSRPTFNAADYRISKQRLSNLVPLRTTAKALWMLQTKTDKFVGFTHPTNKVIQLDDLQVDDLAIDARSKAEIHCQERLDEDNAIEEDRKRRDGATSTYYGKVCHGCS